ncbi:hypothetical protein H2248_001273 [Termitomyces sp. 'cryptogamus']|nr:hypothetical protein H2248_001273 [Termitomyces sp. 'cryptogamus']
MFEPSYYLFSRSIDSTELTASTKSPDYLSAFMANPQLHPFEMNSLTGEPFLRLRNHRQIIITPPRPEDVALYPTIMNDSRIYEWLGSPPFPYTSEHAEEWYLKTKTLSDDVLKKLNAARNEPNAILLNDCPIRNIRELKEDGSDVFLGDIGISRVVEGKFLVPAEEDTSEETKAKYKAANDALPLGDPDIAWTVGCKSLSKSLSQPVSQHPRLHNTKLPWSRHHDRCPANIIVGLGSPQDGSAPHHCVCI